MRLTEKHLRIRFIPDRNAVNERFKWVHFEDKNLVATDGKVLVVMQMDAPVPEPFNLHVNDMLELSKLTKNGTAVIETVTAESVTFSIFAKSNGVTYKAIRQDNDYVDWQGIMENHQSFYRINIDLPMLDKVVKTLNTKEYRKHFTLFNFQLDRTSAMKLKLYDVEALIMPCRYEPVTTGAIHVSRADLQSQAIERIRSMNKTELANVASHLLNVKVTYDNFAIDDKIYKVEQYKENMDEEDSTD